MEILSSKLFFGIVAGTVSFLAHPLYIRAIMRKETVPHIFTWTLSTLLVGLALFFYDTAGGGETVYMLIGDFIGLGTIAVLSFFYGKKNKFCFSDWLCLCGALFSIVVFIIFHNAFWSFIMILATDFFALFPTMKKTFYYPASEDFTAWSFTCTGNLLGLFAMNWMNHVETFYVYAVIVMDGIVWLLIFNGKERRENQDNIFKQQASHFATGQFMQYEKT
ncbi:MAG TPA: hypothetical protein DCS28_02785 [Candidatus Moranbacteria bacterium]|nr:hypothetical protein [Candidatus Moranbacteria bacterium]HAT74942.1 hypothetical protein [Candidatus Moranbacteria bacterium]